MTKIPTEIIQLALEGGWDKDGELKRVNHWRWVALDREFWESLGRKLGWKEGRANWIEWGTVDNLVPQGLPDPIPEWQYHAHRFYQCILSGQDPTEFWQNILSATRRADVLSYLK